MGDLTEDFGSSNIATYTRKTKHDASPSLAIQSRYSVSLTMKALSFLAAYAALLSSLAVAAPVDVRLKQPLPWHIIVSPLPPQPLFLSSCVSGRRANEPQTRRGEDIYTKETLSITGKEKREELYSPSSELYSLGVLKAIEKRDGAGADEKREELYAVTQNLYSKLTLAAKEKE